MSVDKEIKLSAEDIKSTLAGKTANVDGLTIAATLGALSLIDLKSQSEAVRNNIKDLMMIYSDIVVILCNGDKQCSKNDSTDAVKKDCS